MRGLKKDNADGRTDAKHRRVAYNYVIEKFNVALDACDQFDFYGVKRTFNSEKYETYDWCKGMSQTAAKNGMHNAQDAIRRFRKAL